MKKIVVMIFCPFVFSMNAQKRQHINQAVHSFEKAFINRDAEAMKPLLAADFTIGIFGRPSNDIMLTSILERYHQLDSIKIQSQSNQVGTVTSRMKIKSTYYFKGQKPFSSSIVFNEQSKILYVDLFDNIYKIDRYRSSRKVATIPFKMLDGSIVLMAKLNDDEKELTMLFDTGADGMALSRAAFDKMNLKNVRDHSTNVVGGKVNVKFSSGNTLHLDGIDISDQNLVVFPSIGKDLDGIIGGSFIRKYITNVNFDTQEIELYTFGKYDFAGKGNKIKIEFGSVPQLPIKAVYNNDIDITENYVFDTGASYDLITFSAGTKKYNLTANFNAEFSSPTYSGGHASATRSGNVKELKIGSYLFENFNGVVQDYIADSEDHKLPMGSVGINMIKRFNFTLDLLNRNIYLTPNKNFNKPFSVVVAGVIMEYDASNKNLIVKSIIRGSRGETSKIRPGAIVHSINGVSFDELLTSEKRKALFATNEDVFLITQNNQSLQISI